MSKINWNDENVATLTAAAGVAGSAVSLAQVNELAGQFGGEDLAKSVASKLRHMKYDVEKKADAAPAFSDAETSMLVDFLKANEGTYTADEVSAKFQSGKFSTAQIRGKVLSLELTKAIKPAPKKEAVRTYTDAEEDQVKALWVSGKYLEEIAEAIGKSVNSVRGKTLSMLKGMPEGTTLPAQKNKVAAKADILEGIDVANLTVEEIAEQVERTVTGVKATLTRRGISASNYDGAAKRAKADAKKVAE